MTTMSNLSFILNMNSLGQYQVLTCLYGVRKGRITINQKLHRIDGLNIYRHHILTPSLLDKKLTKDTYNCRFYTTLYCASQVGAKATTRGHRLVADSV